MIESGTSRSFTDEEMATIRKVLVELEKCRSYDDHLGKFAHRQMKSLPIPIHMWVLGHRLV